MHRFSIEDGMPTSGVAGARSRYVSAGTQLLDGDVAIADLGPGQLIRAYGKKQFRA